MSQFDDRFASQAAVYAQFRPSYPPAMFAWLASLTAAHDLAWDCATGSGQAARVLAPFFTRVVATDASAAQLAYAPRIANVEYRQAGAESPGLPEESVDLVMVAQALHWLDLAAFYGQVRRVMKRGAAFAASVYGLHRVSPEIDAVMEWFYAERIGPYWDPRRRHVDEEYASLPLPFSELPPRSWVMEATLDRQALVAYVGTWSAVGRCRREEGRDPIPELDAALARVWPDLSAPKRVTWPLTVRSCRRPANESP